MTGLCECGCGQPAPIAPRTDRAFGWIKGQPKRYIFGHRRPPYLGVSRYERTTWNGRACPRHVAIAEMALGKPLPRGAEVHHVDGNGRNNSPSNLVICPNTAYHRLLHARARVVRAGGDPNTENLCRVCLAVMPFRFFHANKGNHALGTCTICKACQKARDAFRYARGLTPMRAPKEA